MYPTLILYEYIMVDSNVDRLWLIGYSGFQLGSCNQFARHDQNPNEKPIEYLMLPLLTLMTS
jgi:hypothetical protein